MADRSLPSRKVSFRGRGRCNPALPTISPAPGIFWGEGTSCLWNPTTIGRYWWSGSPKTRSAIIAFLGEGRREVTLNALEWVWEGESDYPIDGALDIRTLTINARTVKILSPLTLPGADVVINAQILEVGPEAFLDITPQYQRIPPRSEGEDGRHGERAGRIVLNVETLNNRRDDGPAFIASGGRGQEGGPGRDGVDGASVKPIGKEGLIYKDEQKCYQPVEKAKGPAVPIGPKRCKTTKSKAPLIWPQDGEDAVAAGRPGNGGDGGEIVTNIVLGDSEVALLPGESGPPTPAYRGGKPGTPNKARAMRGDGVDLHPTVREFVKGRNASSRVADIPGGKMGRVLPLVEGSWSGHGYRKMLHWYAEDHYLAHAFTRAGDIYRESLQLSQGEDGLDENARLQLQKLSSHRDIFERPLGAVADVYFYRNNSSVAYDIRRWLEALYRLRGAVAGHQASHQKLLEWIDQEGHPARSLQGIEREVKKSLLKHYTDAVHSYQYYHLTPWEGLFPWRELVDEADQLLAEGEGNWMGLEAFFWDILEKIFRSQESMWEMDTLIIDLSEGELEELRREGRIYLNLLDGDKMYRGREGVRIQTIQVDARLEGREEYDLTVVHPGRFSIESGGTIYYGEMASPREWKVGGAAAVISPLYEGSFWDTFTHDTPLATWPGGLTQLMVTSGERELFSRVVLHISYRYRPKGP